MIWEIELIHDLGYGFNINSNNYNLYKDKKIQNIKVDNIEYQIPSFLIFKNFDDVSSEYIQKGLYFSRNLMENKFFSPNNLRFPFSRKLLERKFY